MAKHTKGPWRVYDGGNRYHGIDGGDEGNSTTIVVFGYDHEDEAGVRGTEPEELDAHANAARIVACVNALEGYNPDAVRDVVEALDWAIAEIEKRTRYSPDDFYEAREQRASALEKAKSALSLARLGGAS